MRLLAAAGVFATLGTWLYPFYFPHYSAPIAGILLVLLVQGWRRLSAWSRRARGGGLMIPCAAALAAGMGMFLLVVALMLHNTSSGRRSLAYPAHAVMRDAIEKRLDASGEKHLVMVRYGPNHSLHAAVVYNRARIDESAIVWARELGPQRDEELLRYYSNRTVWLFEPDEAPPRFSRYEQVSSAGLARR